jgi:hypothetical protein
MAAFLTGQLPGIVESSVTVTIGATSLALAFEAVFIISLLKKALL